MPVPGWRVRLKGAEHGFVVDDELAVVKVVKVDQVDYHVRVGDAGEVEVEEDLEVERCGLGVELGELAFHLHPVCVPAAIVDGEGVDAGIFGKFDIIRVVAVGGLLDYHVVGEDEGAGGASLAEGSAR